MTAPQPKTHSQGYGWVVYSGIILLLVGVKLIMDGLWALDRSDTFVDALYYEDDLGTWGWIWLISGIIVFAAGISVFYQKEWARVVGIAAGCYGVIVNLFWLFVAPIGALIGVALSAMVIYGLAVYGEGESTA